MRHGLLVCQLGFRTSLPTLFLEAIGGQEPMLLQRMIDLQMSTLDLGSSTRDNPTVHHCLLHHKQKLKYPKKPQILQSKKRKNTRSQQKKCHLKQKRHTKRKKKVRKRKKI